MPYIKDNGSREILTPEFAAATPGELNFQISACVREYIKRKGLSYEAINDTLGAMEGAKMEFYRRIAAPYEDTKIDQNGDIY